jgi:glycosyltransferase involved in cell wall biosynthesis
MNQPLVSVHVTSYNQEAFIEDTLESVVHQDYPNLQVVIGDDGSSDSTPEIVADYHRKYPERIKLLESSRFGVLGNWNRTLDACDGEYVAILNGDDLYLPGKITAQVEWFEQRDSRVFCGHDVEYFDSETGETLTLSSQIAEPRSGEGAESFVSRGCPFATVSVMVKRSVIPDAGFDGRLRACLDWKFYVDCLADGGEFGFVEGVYGRYRLHDKNTVHRQGDLMWEDSLVALALIEAQHPHLTAAVRQGWAWRYAQRGIAGVQEGRDLQEARRELRVAMKSAPLAMPKLPLWYLLTFAPASLRERLLGERRSGKDIRGRI